MLNTIPTVSFLIATYNRVNFLDKCIESICAQTRQDFEIIVIDDCSDDGTEKLIREKYANRVIFHRHYINRGVAFARNVALDYASGKYLGFIDSDDILCRSDYLEIALNTFKKNANVDIFCCDTFCIDAKGNKIWEEPFLRKTIGLQTRIGSKAIGLTSGTRDFDDIFFHGLHSCGALVRKEIIKEVGFLDTDYKIGWDEDFFLRVSAHKPKAIYYHNEPLTGYRHHPGNISKNAPCLYLERIKCRQEILRKNKVFKKRLGYRANKRLADLYLCLIEVYLKERNTKAVVAAIVKSLFLYPLILVKLLKRGLSFFKKTLGLKR